MTKRRYFTCPIQALYMMKEFGIKFINPLPVMDNLTINCDTYSNLAILLGDLEHLIKRFGKIEICGESEEIFEPRKGDLITNDKNQTTTLNYDSHAIDIEQVEFWGTQCSTLMRGNKQFFNGELENE